MNKTYALVWNHTQGCWNAVGETARRRGKSSGGKCLATVAAVSLLGFAALPAHALPTGEAIASGKADIVRGNDGKSMSINQHTDKLVTQWQDFSVANGERVSFQQPNSQSIALNRVIGNNGSQIHGSIDANGRVFLVNPNGVLFGSGAQVNVGGLVASTKNLADADFLANNFRFTGDSTQSVVNDGRITAANGGSVALFGARVANNGTIQAKLGSVALGAGDVFRVSFDGGGLLNLQVTRGAVDAQASNGGLIKADGGNVLMTARAADSLINAVVNQTGTLEARGLAKRGGKITLDGGTGTVNVGGKLDVSAAQAGAPTGWVTTRSERVNVAADTVVDTRSGDMAGVWTIGAANAGVDAPIGKSQSRGFDNQSNVTGNIGIGVGNGNVNNIAGSNRSIDGDTLSRNLGTTHVALTNLTGDLVVAGPVSWDSDNLLKLTSHNGSVDLQRAVSATGERARMTVNAADQIRINHALKLTGEKAQLEFNAKNGHAIDLDKAVVTLSGKKASFRANGNDYKVLHTFDDLRNVNGNLKGRYVLGNLIDGVNADFTGIGGGAAFTGTFDGLGNTIARVAVDHRGYNSVGLFLYNSGDIANLKLDSVRAQGYGSTTALGTLAGTNNGTISNVTATNVSVTEGQRAGGLVGRNVGVIDKARVSGRIYGGTGTTMLGGLVGENDGLKGVVPSRTRISDSHADVQMTSGTQNAAGGLVGVNNARIERSTSAGSITGGSGLAMIGGLVGNNERDGTITDASSSVDVTSTAGAHAVGGLVGVNWGSIADARATGNVVVGDNLFGGATGVNAGGLVGVNAGDIQRSRADGDVTGGEAVKAGGLAGWNYNYSWIKQSQAHGNVTTGENGWSGGLVGRNSSEIEQSAARGKVATGVNGVAGGAIGVNESSGKVKGSTAHGNVTGSDGATVGGFVGRNEGSIDASSAEGAVLGTYFGIAGGFAGTLADGTTISNSRASGNVAAGEFSAAGGFAGESEGTLDTVSASGTVRVAQGSDAGGLVGGNGGLIQHSTASGDVVAGDAQDVQAGGLAGLNRGSIDNSTASGNVAAGRQSKAGGLVGRNDLGNLTDSTASGNVEGGDSSQVGGLAGETDGDVWGASATGNVKGGSNSQVGGLAGINRSSKRGVIDGASASGTVSGGANAALGGLVGNNFGIVTRSTTGSAVEAGTADGQIAGVLAGINTGNARITGTATGNNGDLPLIGAIRKQTD
ncbi:GLUG motif-containing protein [Burkholderia cenocepacia]|uniref:GLUG motif-containing protein n=1 Tax=Burkholderia cenocepacia TaxID=95486 RepID=UPI002AB6BF60|nr:GLUG motif-containing protein [Burkholderia cenocepacia]